MGRSKDYYRSTLPANVGCYLDERVRLFALIHAVLGMPANQSYKVAFQSKGSLSSCAVQASNLLRERSVRFFIEELESFHVNQAFLFNISALKPIFKRE